jgi:hypothetical protein
MPSRLLSGLVLLLIHISVVNGQATAPPFASLERAVKEQRGGWAGDKSKLSAVFDAERRQIVFDEQGKVIWARAISGHPLLRSACEDAAWQSTFPPMKVSGQPEKVTGVLIYNFVP